MSYINAKPRVAVIGGGITGLTAAWQLQRAGLSPTVFEASTRVGGAIGAVQSDGWLHELGPNSILETSVEISALVEEAGLGSRRMYAAPSAKQRYVIRQGQLVAMPTSPLGFVTTRLFSMRAKLALLGEPWQPRSAADANESVADFVLRRLGREFLDYAINPFVGGVYAGDPARLSVRHAFPKLHALEQEHGSLLRGAVKRRNTSGGPKGRIFSFPTGLSELPRALAAGLGASVRLGQPVTRLRQHADGWIVESLGSQGPVSESYAAVVLALPADALAQLNWENTPAAKHLEILSEIEHPVVSSVFVGYRRCDVRHPLGGFGFLVPAVEQRRVLGALFSSTLFPNRAPDGFVGLTCFVGGVRNPELSSLSNDQRVALVDDELSALIGVRHPPVYSHVHTCPRAIPQYTLDYQRFKEAMTTVEKSAPGLFIGGNCRDGISLGNCIASGQRLADAAFAHTRARNPQIVRQGSSSGG